MATVWYATREQVKAATGTKETARNDAQVARAIASATDTVELDQLDRRFYPELDTRLFDWPVHTDPVDGSRVIPLGRDELVEITELTVEGVTVDPSLYTLLPVNGPLPYMAVELDASVTLAGTSRRRVVGITGRYAFWSAEDAAGTLTAAIDSSTTSVAVSDSAAVGVGHLLLVGTERMLVDDKSMVDTTVNTAAALTAVNSDQSLAVTSAAGFAKGEVILVDAEKMLITAIAGNNLIVTRAWDGSTIAAHNSSVDVYAERRLTVRRGVLGTTAAGHSSGAAVTTHRIPAQVNALTIAEALLVIAQENAAYGRTVGSDDAERAAAGAGIEDLRRRAKDAYGRGTWRRSEV